MRLIIADAAISQAPAQWIKDKSIRRYHQKYHRFPLIDGSIHQHLLRNIPLDQRLDRPDILHFGLLTILGYSPLFDDLEVFFSCDNGTYQVAKDTNLPRSQSRFYGLVESLFTNEQSNDYITRLPDQYPYEFPGETVYFSRFGKHGIDVVNDEICNFVFGGFAHGSYRHDFPEDIKVVSLSNLSLDLWTSLSMVLNRILQQKKS